MRNIVAFDVETTGLDTNNDFVIQLSGVKFDEDFNILDEFNEYINPGLFEIEKEAFEKHGLTKEFILSNGKSMSVVGKDFLDFIDKCDLLSYNGNSFDIRVLSKDLKVFGYNISLDRVFFDSLSLETILNSRKLGVVYKKYTGKDIENAHNALSDVYATIEVFKNQLVKFAEQSISLDDIMNFDESKILSIDGMIKKSEDKIVFRKGKYRGKEFMTVCKNDPGYIKWFMTNPEFDIHTKDILRNYYTLHKNS